MSKTPVQPLTPKYLRTLAHQLHGLNIYEYTLYVRLSSQDKAQPAGEWQEICWKQDRHNPSDGTLTERLTWILTVMDPITSLHPKRKAKPWLDVDVSRSIIRIHEGTIVGGYGAHYNQLADVALDHLESYKSRWTWTLKERRNAGLASLHLRQSP